MLVQTIIKALPLRSAIFVLIVFGITHSSVAQQKAATMQSELKQAFRNAYAPLGKKTRSLPDSSPPVHLARLPAVPESNNTPIRQGRENPNTINDPSELTAPLALDSSERMQTEINPRAVTALAANPTNQPQLADSPVVIHPAPVAIDQLPEAARQEQIEAEDSQTASRNLWWKPEVRQNIDARPPEEIYPELLVQIALQNSPRILAISQQPLIQETEIGNARAEFDPEIFLRTQFDDRVDPVGNQLTTGGLPFLEDHIWTGDSGVRKKLYSGGQIELKQELGFQNSNSNFFDPQNQGTATLRINYSQPLLRGRGRYFNRSQILIAQIGTGITWDKFSAELQDELTKVVEAYWSLYYSRSVLLQKKRNVDRGQIILDRLEGRSELDSLPSQIARARAAVQSRRTEMANAIRDVKNAETEIRRLVNSPQALQSTTNELVPIESPVTDQPELNLDHVISDAMELRPEVKEALKRAKIAAVQRNVSRNELLPELNLIFNTYVAALEADSDIPTAWTHQFTRSTPGYAVGLEFAVPYGRRAAKARLTRQQVVLNQIRSEVDQVLLEVVAESQVAFRRVVSAHRTMLAAVSAIDAAKADLDQNQARWVSFGLVEGDLAEGQSPTTLLDQLLDAQQRLTNAELTYSQALLEFKISEIDLRRARGTLLNHQQVSFNRSCGPCGPEINVHSGGFQQR